MEDTSLSEDIFNNKIDLINKKLENGTLITDYIVDGRLNKPFDVIIYKGIDKNNNPVAIKFLYDEEIDVPLIDAYKNMNKLKQMKIPLYSFYLDYYNNDKYKNDDTNIFLVTDLLYKPNKNDCFNILKQLIPSIWKYRNYMTHCDIKPDNIMCTKDHKNFYFIDYDNSCTDKLLYGYKRTIFTPNFTSQSHVIDPTLITIKQDIIELIVSVHSIYYEKPFNDSWIVYSSNDFSLKYMFALIFIVALNIDEKYVINEDIKLLNIVIDITEKIYNLIFIQNIEIPLLDIPEIIKYNKILSYITKSFKTISNSKILQYVII